MNMYECITAAVGMICGLGFFAVLMHYATKL